VDLGNDSKYAIKGVGTILFQPKLSNSLKLKDVLYVPRLNKNMLSILVMEDKGFSMEFLKGKHLSN